MTVRVSYDDGQTWLLSRTVRTGESAYSDLVIQDDNVIGLLYEHGNDGGIHFAHFNYDWLINGKNQTDHQFVQKIINKNDPYSKEFDFALSPPIIESESIFFENKNKYLPIIFFIQIPKKLFVAFCFLDVFQLYFLFFFGQKGNLFVNCYLYNTSFLKSNRIKKYNQTQSLDYLVLLSL